MGDYLRDENYSKMSSGEDIADDSSSEENLASYFMDAAAERKFSKILWDLFDKDFDIEDTDRRIPEEADSLMDDDRTFLLNCLTGSPSFGYFHRRLAELRRLLGREKTDFPDRRVFIWLTHILYWISRLQEASLPNATIREGDAKQLITAGERVFQNIPDDVQKLLGKHLVHVSAKNKQNNVGVWSREGGAHSSPGILCLRWCALILEALKSDYDRLLEWMHSNKQVCETIQGIIFGNKGNSPDPKAIYTLYDCEQEMWRLEHEEEDMVVRGRKEASPEVHSMVKLYLDKFASDEMRQDYAAKEYGTADAVGPHREDLLDSMLVRVEAYGSLGVQNLAAQEDDNDKKKTGSPSNCPRRKKIRLRFFEAFWKRLVLLPGDLKETFYSLCRWKAWEVEDALDDVMTEKGDDACRQQHYYKPARLLVHSIEDPKSSLFLRVLNGEISADELIRMSPDDLANPVIQAERQAAVSSAKARLNLAKSEDLNCDYSEKPNETTTMVYEGPVGNLATEIVKPAIPAAKEEGPLPKDEDIFFNKSAVKPYTLESQEDQSDLFPETLRPLVKGTGAAKRTSPTGGEVLPMEAEMPIAKVQKLSMKDFLARMPAKVKEPSLMSSNDSEEFSSGPNADAQVQVPIPNMVRNREGHQLFQFFFKKTEQVDFDALLEKHKDDDHITNDFLPQVFSLRGGCPIQHAHEFLSAKLKNTRYSHFSVRVKPQASHLDQYKKFYHHYETTEKIAMFTLPGEGAKAFLITPKYHVIVKSLSLPSPHGTYLIGYKAKKIAQVDLP